MRLNLTMLAVMLITGAVVSMPAAYAQTGSACTNNTIAGTYSLTCSGWIAAGPGGTLVPMMQVGVATGDADGNWSGFTSINIGGQTIIPKATVLGKTSVNPDCTGNIVYNKGTTSELNINYVANVRTDQIFGLIINNGTVATCTLRLTSR
jgi:hypothetical protein